MLQTISSVLDQLQKRKKKHMKSIDYRKGQHWLSRRYFYKGIEWINSNLTGLCLLLLWNVFIFVYFERQNANTGKYIHWVLKRMHINDHVYHFYDTRF